VRLRNLQDDKELSQTQLSEILGLLEALDKFARGLRRKGGDFAAYLEQRHPATHELPKHLVIIREGNEESVRYFYGNEDLARFAEENADLNLGLSGEKESDASALEKGKNGTGNGPTRRARHEELYESQAIKELLERLAHKGLQVEHYSAQDKPLFELLEGDGDKQQSKPLFAIPEILEAIKEVGRRGLQIRRFKGLGEMNPRELFDTTMNPAHRKLLRIDLTDAVEAEEMFTKLMGEEVEPRKQFIEDNALNVRNLDV
jgi:DNA gyrase subunit B